jgi:hypothetical protein
VLPHAWFRSCQEVIRLDVDIGFGYTRVGFEWSAAH